MKSKEEIVSEYWKRKLEELWQARNKAGNDSVKHSVNIENFATEINRALREEIPAESVKVEVEGESNGEDMRILYVAIRLYDNTVLEFISSRDLPKRGRKKPKEPVVMLHSTNARHIFMPDMCDYKTLIEQFIHFYKHYELYCEELQSLLYESAKQEKIRQTARATIHTLIPSLMAQTDYEWSLVEEDDHSVLQVKMKRAKMLEITLDYENFADKIPDLLNVIQQMDKLISEMPYPVDIKNCGEYIPWNKGGVK